MGCCIVYFCRWDDGDLRGFRICWDLDFGHVGYGRGRVDVGIFWEGHEASKHN